LNPEKKRLEDNEIIQGELQCGCIELDAEQGSEERSLAVLDGAIP
jgi:hypothetical protein